MGTPAAPPATPPTMAPMGADEDEAGEEEGAGGSASGAGELVLAGVGDDGGGCSDGDAAGAALGEMPHVCSAPADIV